MPGDLPAPIIVVDQFEEIFTLGRESIDRRKRSNEFFHQLADLVLNNCPDTVQQKFESDREAMRRYDFDQAGYKVVLSMREEYLAFLEEAHQPLRALTQQRLRLTEMSGTQALEAITNAGGHLLEDGAGQDIIRYVAGSAQASAAEGADFQDMEVTPALLSLICSELNNYRLKEGLPRISGTLVSGTAEQILADFYEGCFEGLDEDVKIFVEDQLLTTTGYRDAIAVEDAVQFKGVTAEAIQVLVARRLLRLDKRVGAMRLELTHDILVVPCRASRDPRQSAQRGSYVRFLKACASIEVVLMWTVWVIAASLGIFIYVTFILAQYWESRDFKVFLVSEGFINAIALLAASRVISPRTRLCWIVRFILATINLGVGGIICAILVRLIVHGGSDVPTNVLLIAFMLICCFLPGLFQAINLTSVFNKIFKVKRRAKGRITS